MIRNLIFDFGKVLVNHNTPAVVERYFKGDKRAERDCLDILSSPEFTEACDRGVVPFDELIRKAQHENPRFADALRFFRNNYLAEVTEIEGMREILAGFKARGFKLYGLSNWCDDVREVMRRHGIFDLLDGRVVSCEEHMVKPETGIYLRLCERYGLEPAECLFTDDVMKNVEGAEAAGMHAVLFTTPENYVADAERICARLLDRE